ncbi:zinc-dependent alcohol dehydrogenase family protein [Kribbella sp. NBC_00709]|uniref:zinc-dependent alcohol dehydrogenase family protein n=1 Tax=Kribbella sp. NBC_00709 TaxID=2975972 RepID=UPI002E2E8025|nr:zinc-dependent alcohol dehydrogenase family protein [Kribbella sp. NBC_00709]
MARAVRFDRLGGPEVLRVEEVAIGDPGPDEVRLRVDAIGVNRAEANFRAGTYVYQPVLPGSGLGYEAAGVVEAVGEGVLDFLPGDVVSALPAFLMTEYAAYAETAILPARALVRHPGNVDAMHAAATWMAYSTAYGMLLEFGGLVPAMPVLITGASSSVGIAAIQIANSIGAIPIATTRTVAKQQRLFDAGAAHVVVTDTHDVVKEVLSVTKGEGVALAIDAIGGAGLSTLIQTVAPGGSLVVYGWLDPAPMPFPVHPDFRARNVRTYAFTEVTMDADRIERAKRFVSAGLRTGALDPVIDRAFDLTEVADAHRYLEANTQLGKVVLTVDR